MAVTFDRAVAAQVALNQREFAWAHEVGPGEGRVLFVAIGTGAGGAPDGTIAPLVDGVPMQHLTTQVQTHYSELWIELWYILNPPTGELEIEYDRGEIVGHPVLGSLSLIGVDLDDPWLTPHIAAGGPPPASATVPSAEDGLVLDWLLQISHTTTSRDMLPDAGQTVRLDLMIGRTSSGNQYPHVSASTKPGTGAPVTMGWDAAQRVTGYAHIVLPLRPLADDPGPDEGELHSGLRLSFSFAGSAGRSGQLATILDAGSATADQPARTGESETPLEVESDATGIPARYGTALHQLTAATTAQHLTAWLGETLQELAAGLDADGGRADAGTIAPGLGVAHEAEGTAGRSGSATHHLTAATDLDGAAGRRGAFTAPLDAATDATGRAARSGDFALYLTSRVHLQGAGEDDGTGYATRLHVGVAYAMHSARSGGMPVILHTAITADGQGARLDDFLAALTPDVTLDDRAGRRSAIEAPLEALVGGEGHVERRGALVLSPALSASAIGHLARSGAAAVRSALRVILRGRAEGLPPPRPEHIARAAAVRRVAVAGDVPRTAHTQRPRRVVG